MSTTQELPSEDPIPGRDQIQRAEDRCIGALSQALAVDEGPNGTMRRGQRPAQE